MTDRARPWIVYRGTARRECGRYETRIGAIRRCDKPWSPGFFLIEHERTLETWERRCGSWFKTRMPDPTRKLVQPATGDAQADAAEEPAEQWWQKW